MAEESKDGGASAPTGLPAGIEVPVLGPSNARGIPEMKYIESVSGFLEAESTTVATLLGSLQLMHKKYELMQKFMRSNREDVANKIPAIEVNIKVVKHLQSKQESGDALTTHFSLCDNVQAKAIVEPCDRVGLWVGAGVMVEYSYEEALKVLHENLDGARRKLSELEGDLDFLRDNIITTQVNMARVVNHDVKVQREMKKKAAEADAGAAASAPSAVTAK